MTSTLSSCGYYIHVWGLWKMFSILVCAVCTIKNIFKKCRGRQRKPWNKYVDELFDVLRLPKGELLDDIREGQCPFFVECKW